MSDKPGAWYAVSCANLKVGTREFEYHPIKVRKLEVGLNILTYSGVSVPVDLRPNGEAVVDIANSDGNREMAGFWTYGDDLSLSYVHGIGWREVVCGPTECLLRFKLGPNEVSTTLQWFEEPPVVKSTWELLQEDTPA